MGEALMLRATTRSIWPPEVFDNPDFQRGSTVPLAGRVAVRSIISHEGDPMSQVGGIARIAKIKTAAMKPPRTPLIRDLPGRYRGDVQGLVRRQHP